MNKSREVASGVVNLGSTCYMNAVLQALAHSPELLSAVECESHHKNCPIAIKNANLKKEKVKKEEEAKNNGLGLNDSNDGVAIKSENESNTNGCCGGSRQRKKTLSPNGGKRRKSNGKSNGSQAYQSEDEFCLLCELEKHLMRVHYSGTLGVLEKNYDEMCMGLSSNSNHYNNNGGGPIAPSAFVHGFIEHVAPWFKLGVQEDSHEFLRLLIDAMQKSYNNVKEFESSAENCNEVMIKKEDDIKQEENGDSTIKREEMEDGHNVKREDTSDENVSNITVKKEDMSDAQSSQHDEGDEYAYRLFRGKVESIVTCSNCGALSSTIDPIEDIGLEVTSTSTSYNYGRNSGRGRISPTPAASTLLDLKGALDKFIKTEKLDSAYKCESCGAVGHATKQNRLASIPPILTFHLKRFRYGRDGGKNFAELIPPRRRNNELAQLLGADLGSSGSAKIEGHVNFSAVVDMHPYLTKELQDELGRNVVCTLFSVVVHAGKNSHSGHYISYVRNLSKNEWWKMDDSKVTRVSNSEVTQAEAYMLFYRVAKHPVSVELIEKEQKMKAERAKKIAIMKEMKIKEEEVAKEKMAFESRLISKKRKREDPEFKSGEEWIKAMTHIPDSWIPTFRKAQDYISQCINFNASYFRDIQDEAKVSGVVGVGPKIGIDNADIQEGNDVSHALKEFLQTIIKPHQKDIIPGKDTNVPTKKEDVSQQNGVDRSATERNSFIFPIQFDTNETML